MHVLLDTYKKTKVVCERCGTNLRNVKIAFTQREGESTTRPDGSWVRAADAWKARRSRRFWSGNVYLCFDCAVEATNNLAKEMLAHIITFNYKKVQDYEYIKELAAIRHERQVFNKKQKEIKVEIRQEKKKESNNGLNLVGETI